MRAVVLLILLNFTLAFGDTHEINDVAIDSADMKHVTCLPVEANLSSKKAYIKELKKYGVFAYSVRNIPRFKLEHFEDILFAAKLMPSWLKLGTDTLDAQIRIIYRHELDSVANAFIALGPKWFEFDKNLRRAVIFHELAHRLDTKFYNQDNDRAWMNIDSGWESIRKGNRKVLQAKGATEYVSEYASKNSMEDWAESVSAYRLKPDLLKRVSQNKYNFLKEYLFLGQEFTNEENCKEAPDFISSQDFNEQVEKLKKYYSKNKKNIKANVKKKKNKLQPALYTLLKSMDQTNPLPKKTPIEEVVKRYRFKLFIQNTKEDVDYPSGPFIMKLNKVLR